MVAPMSGRKRPQYGDVQGQAISEIVVGKKGRWRRHSFIYLYDIYGTPQRFLGEIPNLNIDAMMCPL